MLFSILLCTEQSLQQKIRWAPITIAKVKKLCLKVNLLAPHASRSFLGVALFFITLPSRAPLPRAFSLVTFPQKFPPMWARSWGSCAGSGQRFLWFASVLTAVLWRVSLKPWTLEGAGSGEAYSEGTVRTNCSPESCPLASASLLLWSHCHSDDMHRPLGDGRVSLLGQDARRYYLKWDLGKGGGIQLLVLTLFLRVSCFYFQRKIIFSENFRNKGLQKLQTVIRQKSDGI